MSLEEQFQNNEDEIVNELLEESNSNVDEEFDFIIKPISKYYAPEFVTDEFNVERVLYPQPPKDDNYYPLMLSVWKDGNKKILQKEIENPSAQEMYFEELQKLYDYIESFPPEPSLTESQDDVSYNISRPLQGLSDVIERFTNSYNEYIDPSIPKKKKTGKLLRDKQDHFLRTGYKHMISLIEHHIDTLIEQADFPALMFGRYKKLSQLALANDNIDEALKFGMQLVLCAEVVLPVTEELVPRKRVTEQIAVGMT